MDTDARKTNRSHLRLKSCLKQRCVWRSDDKRRALNAAPFSETGKYFLTLIHAADISGSVLNRKHSVKLNCCRT